MGKPSIGDRIITCAGAYHHESVAAPKSDRAKAAWSALRAVAVEAERLADMVTMCAARERALLREQRWATLYDRASCAMGTVTPRTSARRTRIGDKWDTAIRTRWLADADMLDALRLWQTGAGQ